MTFERTVSEKWVWQTPYYEKGTLNEVSSEELKDAGVVCPFEKVGSE